GSLHDHTKDFRSTADYGPPAHACPNLPPAEPSCASLRSSTADQRGIARPPTVPIGVLAAAGPGSRSWPPEPIHVKHLHRHPGDLASATARAWETNRSRTGPASAL